MHPAALVPVLYVAVVTPPLVLIDLREHRLPNLYVVPGIGLGILAAAVQWSLVPLLAGAAYAGILWLLPGVGMGDVKLAALLGLAAGSATLAAATVTFLAGGAAASIVLLRRGRGARLAFGPWMLLGFWVATGVWASTGP